MYVLTLKSVTDTPADYPRFFARPAVMGSETNSETDKFSKSVSLPVTAAPDRNKGKKNTEESFV